MPRRMGSGKWWYSDIAPRADLRGAEVARAYRLDRCKDACHSSYNFYLEEDVQKFLRSFQTLPNVSETVPNVCITFQEFSKRFPQFLRRFQRFPEYSKGFRSVSKTFPNLSKNFQEVSKFFQMSAANAARLGGGLGAVCAHTVLEPQHPSHVDLQGRHGPRGGGGDYGIRTARGGSLANLGLVVFKILLSVTTSQGTTYGPMHYGQTHGRSQPPALVLFLPSPISCFATWWTQKCFSPSRRPSS